MEELDIIKNKTLRGSIIEKLYSCYGDDITVANLKQMLAYGGYNSDREIKKAVYYLTGQKKEYVKLVFNKENYMESLIWLTPSGVNLAEGDIEDIGVIISE